MFWLQLGIEPRFLGRPAHSLVAIPTTLSRIRIIVLNTNNFFYLHIVVVRLNHHDMTFERCICQVSIRSSGI
jgi:hypothetical protein